MLNHHLDFGFRDGLSRLNDNLLGTDNLVEFSVDLEVGDDSLSILVEFVEFDDIGSGSLLDSLGLALEELFSSDLTDAFEADYFYLTVPEGGLVKLRENLQALFILILAVLRLRGRFESLVVFGGLPDIHDSSHHGVDVEDDQTGWLLLPGEALVVLGVFECHSWDL